MAVFAVCYGKPVDGNFVVLSNIDADVPECPYREILLPLKLPWWPNITVYPELVL